MSFSLAIYKVDKMHQNPVRIEIQQAHHMQFEKIYIIFYRSILKMQHLEFDL